MGAEVSETPDTVPTPIQILRQMVGASSQKAVAAQLGVSGSYVCDVLKGRRDVTKRLAKALGYQRVVIYMPLPEPPK